MRIFKTNKLNSNMEIATAKTPRNDNQREIGTARTPRKGIRKLGLVVCLLIFLAGCSSQFLAQPTLIPTDTPSPTLTDTATTVWFPPTDTPTAMPAQVVQPTVDEKPSVEDELLVDDFTNPAQWSTGQTAAGSVAFGDKELTLAVSQPKGALLSLSKVSLGKNFYLEITVDLSLCKGGDAYGLLLRASSPADYYRFVISCTGQLRLERVKNSQLAIVQDWTPAGQIPPGSPLLLRLGVWSAGSEMRFFINGDYQFSASDPVFTGGALGVFARSAGDTPVTVSFSDLHLYALGELPLPLPSPTVTPPVSPTAAR
jgi:hypothetical protein